MLSDVAGSNENQGSSQESQRVALVIQYLGTHFHGWQRQLRQRTVQEEIESTVQSVLGHPVTLHGAGRTDSGVHAAAQVAHFDAKTLIPAHRWASILNHRLPDDVLIRGSAQVDKTWHSRFSATWRRYRYTIYTDPRFVCASLLLALLLRPTKRRTDAEGTRADGGISPPRCFSPSRIATGALLVRGSRS
jgi:tRNA pseudouridine(38-40) synthase